MDTCGILDVVRSCYRFQAPIHLLEGAVGAIGASVSTPAALHIIVFEQIETELEKNIVSERANLRKEMAKLEATGKIALSLSDAVRWRASVAAIEKQLSGYPDASTAASHRVSNELQCVARARARLAVGEKPGNRGSNNIADCVIVEHLLELGARLRAAAFSRDILFVSSNKRDFGGPLGLKSPLDVQFSAQSIDFYPDIDSAIRQIKRTYRP